MFVRLVGSILAVMLMAPAVGCDLCSLYSANQARGEAGKGPLLSVAGQFTSFGSLQEGGRAVANPVGQHLESYIFQVVPSYNLNERFGLQLNLPVVDRSFRRPDGFAVENGTESGFGDIALLAHLRVWHWKRESRSLDWRVLGGLKLPSGDTRRLAEELNEVEVPGAPRSGIHGHDLTLGTGSADGLLGTSVTARWRRGFLTSWAQYGIHTAGDFDYQFANDIIWSGGPGYFLALRDNWSVSLQFRISGESKGLDSFRGTKAGDTGVTSIFLGPEMGFTWSERFSVEIAGELPVSIDNTALQAVPDYRIRGSLTWRF